MSGAQRNSVAFGRVRVTGDPKEVSEVVEAARARHILLGALRQCAEAIDYISGRDEVKKIVERALAQIGEKP